MVTPTDAPDLAPGFLEAGVEFDAALVRLGLEANLVAWAYDIDLQHHVLLLITDFFDFKGPLEISKKLFAAYSASALPQEIDPFTIRLHSVNQIDAVTLLKALNTVDWKMVKGKPTSAKGIDLFLGSDQLGIHSQWIIQYRDVKKRPSTDLIRKWDRFSRNVEALAA
jgi:hypothetical protein